MEVYTVKKFLLLTVAALSFSACGPTVVTGIIADGDRVRFIHGDGIIQCQTPKAGEAKACRNLNIQYED